MLGIVAEGNGHELFPAVPGDDIVLTHSASGKRLRNRDQAGVAVLMAEMVVKFLEVVDINDHHGDRDVVALVSPSMRARC